jgi:hypothetical protein
VKLSKPQFVLGCRSEVGCDRVPVAVVLRILVCRERLPGEVVISQADGVESFQKLER